MATDIIPGVVKTLKARRDISLSGTRRVKGPVRQLAVRRLVHGKWEQQFLPLDTKLPPHDTYDVIETEPGETFECASLVARDLVTSGQCELLAGGFFSVDDSGDVPKILPWVVTCTEYHRPHEEGPYETVETLRDAPYSPGWPAKRGVRLRIVLANFEGTFCYQDEPTEGYAFRVLRPNPNLKTVSINSEAQGKLVKQLWNQVFPQNPLTA